MLCLEQQGYPPIPTPGQHLYQDVQECRRRWQHRLLPLGRLRFLEPRSSLPLENSAVPPKPKSQLRDAWHRKGGSLASPSPTPGRAARRECSATGRAAESIALPAARPITLAAWEAPAPPGRHPRSRRCDPNSTAGAWQRLGLPRPREAAPPFPSRAPAIGRGPLSSRRAPALPPTALSKLRPTRPSRRPGSPCPLWTPPPWAGSGPKLGTSRATFSPHAPPRASAPLGSTPALGRPLDDSCDGLVAVEAAVKSGTAR
mmetsp:Transcript_22510/g.64768  ORF Transcript_22510/g.64768 Transcript_22510/m.64768 type:complete len:258 (-) Transcript_22510:133-906(-)